MLVGTRVATCWPTSASILYSHKTVGFQAITAVCRANETAGNFEVWRSDEKGSQY